MTIKHLFPKAKPALNLDFANARELDRRIAFTRASTGTYVDSDRLIKTAASGEARFDHDPVTGESLGLLIEESRANSITYSDFSSGWKTTEVVATPNAGLAPDGTNTAVKIAATTAASFHSYSAASVASTSLRTLSLYVKPAGEDTVYLGIYEYGGQGITADLSAGTASKGIITPAGNGWYRISYTVDYASRKDFIIMPGGRSASAGDGTSGILVWGPQLESGASFSTSYIPTSGSAVTRSADVASVTNSGIYNTNSFTILNEPFGSAAGASTLSLIGGGETPIKRTAVYSQDLTHAQINANVGNLDGFWRWRILGSSFGLPNFVTDGQVTVDWGDGTVETLTTSDHTFTDGGGYHEIGFRLDSGTYFRPYINNNASHVTKVVAVGPAPESMKFDGQRAFFACTNLEAFDAAVDPSGGADLYRTWRACTNLKSFPALDTSSIASFGGTWANCSSLTSFPLLNIATGTSFTEAWLNCTGLTSFPAKFFDSWTATPANSCFVNAWDGCSSLTATSVENILNSIDTSGRSAPATGADITIDYNAGSGTPSIATAVANLKARGWTITLNGVAQ